MAWQKHPIMLLGLFWPFLKLLKLSNLGGQKHLLSAWAQHQQYMVHQYWQRLMTCIMTMLQLKLESKVWQDVSKADHWICIKSMDFGASQVMPQPFLSLLVSDIRHILTCKKDFAYLIQSLRYPSSKPFTSQTTHFNLWNFWESPHGNGPNGQGTQKWCKAFPA